MLKPRHALTLRVRAVGIIANVLAGSALDAALNRDRSHEGRHGLVEELAIGTVRHAPGLMSLVEPLLKRPFKNADRDIYALILMGLYQAQHMDSPQAVAVSEAVATTEALGKAWARGVVNAVLRSALKAEAPAAPFAVRNHPSWLVERLKTAWPDRWLAILEANDERAPLCLRVDTGRIPRDEYLETLSRAGIKAAAHPIAPTAIALQEGARVLELPGFGEGLVSVQDAAAQLAAPLLAAEPGDSVLDACAAPGGKTGHLAQSAPKAQLTAADRGALRLAPLRETLARLGLSENVRVLDIDLVISALETRFQRILLDAPCSATGVIRRHPDIKIHRRADDLGPLRETQALLLDRLWHNLVPGGTLVYATCSVLPEENEEQIRDFLRRTKDAMETPFTFSVGEARLPGWQFLPGDAAMDGFYYARLSKMAGL